MPEFNYYAARIAKKRMMATDYLSLEKWLAHVETLSTEQVQREMLRQATDAKLQLISIINTLHLSLIVMVVLMGIVIWRIW
jgi:hypothetical protein